MKFQRVAIMVAAGALLGGCRKSGPPYGPREALEMFRIESGFRIEVFAAEPDVVSPVAMEFDEDGRIYVVEDRGYPLETEKKLGRVKLLEDTNGDGRPDRSTIFADQLVLPTGVMRWKKGILVTDAPNVWYFEDTDGDGRADVRRIVLTGFAFTNPQHTVNGPVYGLDNWIYLAHENPATAIIFKEQFGDRGSDIRFAGREAPVVTERGRNIRFRPDRYELEALSGTSQFGHAFDEWGHHFTLNNSNHARHEVIAARYLKRNPDLPVGSAMQDISDHGAAAKVFPITARPRFEMLTNVGEFTSACGLTLYLGGAFPRAYHGAAFVAEPAHNLVHLDRLKPNAATFTASRWREGAEFLASTDAWFRPVNFYVGPDGALYLLDYYRLVIEHPEWMSTHTHHSKELYEGIDRGRIYRIVPEGGLAPPRRIRLGEATDAELVRQLENPNLWWRRTAQRLLVDRKAAGAVPALRRMAETSGSAVGRLHALWTLEGLGALDAALIEKALGDAEPGTRENAIVLAERRLAGSPALPARLLKMTGDLDARVRFQLLATLGFAGAEARVARDRLLEQQAADRWFQIAALSASSDEAVRLFERASNAGLARQAAAVIGARQRPAEIRRVLDKATFRPAELEGLAAGMRGRKPGKGEWGGVQAALLRLFGSADGTVRRTSLRLLEITGLPPGAAAALKKAEATAQDDSMAADARADAIGLLGAAAAAEGEALFRRLLDPKQPEPVQAAAVRALGRIKGTEIGRFLIGNWRNMTPAVRGEAADAMFSDPKRTPLLLAALKAGDVQAWTLAFRHKRQLVMHRDSAIREAARPIFEQSAAEREAVVKRYEAALDRKTDAARGEAVFKQVCAKCHRLNGAGAEVGPDLATVRHQPKRVLLEDILMPSKAISQGFEAYVVETVSGGNHDGVLGSQTPTTITLRHEDGKEDVIRRSDIKSMYVTNLSAMPADLEKQVDMQQMADLLEYIKAAR